MIVSCQLSSTMAMNAEMTVTEFCTIVVAVSVRTVRTALTSLASRDWIAPVLVAVKKASSIFCRCAKRSLRRSAIAELPIVLVSRFCPMPISAVAIGMAHSPATSQPSRWKSAGPPVGREERVVEDGLGQERRRDPEQRGHDHGQDDQEHLAAVRGQQPRDPPQRRRRTVGRRVLRHVRGGTVVVMGRA